MKGTQRSPSELELYREGLRARAELVRLRREERREALLAARERRVLGVTDDVQRLEIRDPDRSSLWTGLAVGLGIAALIGVGVAIFVILRRDGSKQVVYLPVAAQGTSSNQPALAAHTDDDRYDYPARRPRRFHDIDE